MNLSLNMLSPEVMVVTHTISKAMHVHLYPPPAGIFLLFRRSSERVCEVFGLQRLTPFPLACRRLIRPLAHPVTIGRIARAIISLVHWTDTVSTGRSRLSVGLRITWSVSSSPTSPVEQNIGSICRTQHVSLSLALFRAINPSSLRTHFTPLPRPPHATGGSE